MPQEITEYIEQYWDIRDFAEERLNGQSNVGKKEILMKFFRNLTGLNNDEIETIYNMEMTGNLLQFESLLRIMPKLEEAAKKDAAIPREERHTPTFGPSVMRGEISNVLAGTHRERLIRALRYGRSGA